MADAPDLDTLAKRYLDLWQEQFSAMASDPALAEAMTQWLGLMGLGRTAPDAARGHHDGNGQARPAAGRAAPGPDTPAAAPDPGGAGAAQLADRLAAVEERLAAVESRLGGARKPARPRARRRRS
jgi:hypothetical protein